MPKDINPANAGEILDSMRKTLGLPPDAKLQAKGVSQTARGTKISFTYVSSIPLEGESLGDVAGVRVDVSGEGSVTIDSNGKITNQKIESSDPRQLKAIRDNVTKLVANGEVYVPKPGEVVDREWLRTHGKTWYVEQNESGERRLRRAQIA